MFKKFNVYYNENTGFFDHYEGVLKDSPEWRFCYSIKSYEEALFEHRFSMGMYNTLLYANTVGIGKPTLHSEILKAKQIFLKHNLLYFTIHSIIPPLPGVYFLYDEWGYLIYIGKAINLHRRLPDSLRDKKTAKFFQFAVTKSDGDAVIYEQYYMGKHPKPLLNKDYPSEVSSDINLPELTFTTKTEIKPIHLMQKDVFLKKAKP